MNTKPIRTLCRAALIACVIGAGSFSVADEAADDLQAGIDAFNSGDLPGAMTLYEKAAEAGSPEALVSCGHRPGVSRRDRRAGRDVCEGRRRANGFSESA
jgi:hypothetical protein